MKETIFEHRHTVDGEIKLERDGSEVGLTCRWPFDTSTDEWIYVSNRFDAAAYDAGIRDLASRGAAVIPGKASGELRLTIEGSEKVRLYAIDQSPIRPQQLDIVLETSSDNLLIPTADLAKT